MKINVMLRDLNKIKSKSRMFSVVARAGKKISQALKLDLFGN